MNHTVCLGGVELGEVSDNLVGEQETKRKQGAAGYFAKGVVAREKIYTDGLVAALVPFLNENLFMKGGYR